MLSDGIVVMVAAYAKNEKEDLSPTDRKAILAVIEEIDG